MRGSGNPIKVNQVTTPEFKRHRLIIPVYIPEVTGYYRDAMKIFEICVQSVLATTNRQQVDITIIDNASIPDVRELVQPYVEKGLIDQYLQNSVNRGKADAIIGHAKSCYEPFVTISDADVLFRQGWLSAIEEIYREFPAAGVVCPFPTPYLRHHHCVSTWLNHSWQIRRSSVIDKETLLDLEEKIGAIQMSDRDLKSQFYVRKKTSTAILGAGHFVATYRQCVFRNLDYTGSRYGLKKGLREIEAEVDRIGLSRLSCPENRVFHMGNLIEDWMRAPSVETTHVDSPFETLRLSRPWTASTYLPGWMRQLLARLLLVGDAILYGRPISSAQRKKRLQQAKNEK